MWQLSSNFCLLAVFLSHYSEQLPPGFADNYGERVKTTMSKNFKYLFLFVFSGFSACSLFSGEEQFTNKVVAPLFEAELYGSSTEVLAISHEEASHISWMGFVESNNYEYFKITKVQLGTTTLLSDGVEIDGETYTASSNSIVEDISVGISDEGDDNGYANGSISVAGSSDLKITVEYSPLLAIESEDEPHEAYLIIYYDEPQVGAMRIKLEGYTNGIKADKCTGSVAAMDLIQYKFVNDKFDLYFCSALVAQYDQNNTTTDPSDADYHGLSTNLAEIDMTDQVLSFYMADEETMCLLTSPTPSIPDFTIPIPEIPGVPIETMDISMPEGSYAECQIGSDGSLFCDDNIQIKAVVATSNLTATTGTLAQDDYKTSDCSDFGDISGSGAFLDDTFSLVLTGTVEPDQYTQEYNIVDARIIADLHLECDSGC
jgi:hypothetical protein